MQELVFITCIIPVLLLLIWNRGNIDKSGENCESFSEIDGFNIEENVSDVYEMQEFEGGGDSSAFCRDGICTDNLLMNNRIIDELSMNDSLKFHDLSLRTNSSFQSIEKLLAHAVLKRCGQKGLFVATTLLFSDRRTGNSTLLTAVKAETFQQKGYARVSRGGVFQNHVELQLRSEKGDGFQYEISVYGLD